MGRQGKGENGPARFGEPEVEAEYEAESEADLSRFLEQVRLIVTSVNRVLALAAGLDSRVFADEREDALLADGPVEHGLREGAVARLVVGGRLNAEIARPKLVLKQPFVTAQHRGLVEEVQYVEVEGERIAAIIAEPVLVADGEVGLREGRRATQIATPVKRDVIDVNQRDAGRERRAALRREEGRNLRLVGSAAVEAVAEEVLPVERVGPEELEGVRAVRRQATVVGRASDLVADERQVEETLGVRAVAARAVDAELVRTGEARIVAEETAEGVARGEREVLSGCPARPCSEAWASRKRSRRFFRYAPRSAATQSCQRL